MGSARFLYNNLITSDAILTASNERAGQVGLAVKVGQGSASLQASGPYTGARPGQYIVEIDSTAAGAGVGQATFRWRPTSTAVWSASGVATATTPVALEHGLTVIWTAGGGTDLVVGDYWTITVDKPYGKARLLDLDRDTEWRSADASGWVTLDIDFGAAQTVDVVAFCDHNITAGQNIQIAGDSVTPPVYGVAPVSEQVAAQSQNVLRYLTTTPRTYRYWRLSLYDGGNPDGYLRIGELYLGTYMVFARNFDRQWGRSQVAATYGPTGALRSPRGVWTQAEVLDLAYRVMTAADRTQVRALFDYLYNPAVGTVRPILVNPDSADSADVSLYELDTPELPIQSPFVDLYEWALRLKQRPRLARSGS